MKHPDQSKHQNQIPPENPLIPFTYQSSQVRTIKKPDKSIWFVVNDVCKVLGIANPWDAVSKLDDDERDDLGIAEVMGRVQKTNVINESGLYALILRSRKPEAKIFRKWVTSEVLPAIRQNGFYTVQTKTCRRCRVPKPVSEFHCNRRNKDGRHDHCKTCRNETGYYHSDKSLPESKPSTIDEALVAGAHAAMIFFEKLSRSGNDMTLIRRIFKYRIKGLTQSETGTLTGLTKWTVREYERLARSCGLFSPGLHSVDAHGVRPSSGIRHYPVDRDSIPDTVGANAIRPSSPSPLTGEGRGGGASPQEVPHE